MQYETPTSWILPNSVGYGSPDNDKWETDMDPAGDDNNG